jgi:glycosyltransferase involved in cell wall biosynthesis
MSPFYTAMPSLGPYLASTNVLAPMVLTNESNQEIIAVIAPLSKGEGITALTDAAAGAESSGEFAAHLVHTQNILRSEKADSGDFFTAQDAWFQSEKKLREILFVRIEWTSLPSEFAALPFWYLKGANSPIGVMARLAQPTSPEPYETGVPLRDPLTPSDIDVVAVTTHRYSNVRELVRSIRRQLGDSLRITVVIQSKKTWKWTRLGRRYKANFLHVEEDRGLSWSRNHGVRHTDRRLVFLMDDDFQIDDRCRLVDALAIMNRCPSISVLAGNLLDVGRFKASRDEEISQSYAMHLHEEGSSATWYRVQDGPRERVFLSPTDYIEHVDIVDNFALIRREDTFDRGVFWNPELKISAEHPDIYMRMKRLGGIKIARTNALKVRNVRLQDRKFRLMRQRRDFTRVFLRYWSLKSFVVVGEFSSFLASDGSVWSSNRSSANARLLVSGDDS